jgi:flavin-dependent dehydrogenase
MGGVQNSQRWDVLVLGGGPAGAAAALSLRKAGALVLLVEASRTAAPHPGNALRGEGLVCLDELGLGAEFLEQNQLVSKSHCVRWGARVSERSTREAPYVAPYHIDRSSFDEFLLRACEQRGVTVRRGARCMDARLDGHQVVVSVREESGMSVEQAPLAIDATGRSARISRRLGGKRSYIDGLLGLWKLCSGDGSVGFGVETGPDGWWYSAPAGSNRLSVVYFTELGRGRLRPLEEIWSQALLDAPWTSSRLTRFAESAPCQVYRAGPEWTELDASVPVLPVGDAAMSFDPISGDGLCFALRSGLEAARALHEPSLRSSYLNGARDIYAAHLRSRECAYLEERRIRTTSFWRVERDRPRQIQASATASPP